MNDRIDQSNDQPICDSRANLFFFLQKLAKETHARTIVANDSESPITVEHVGAHQRNGGMI
jgi:hypothetical protein